MALLSVAQLVDRTAPPSEDRVALWQRRVRLWSDAGILPTVGPRDGTRKHRRYSDSMVYLAAVLLRISDFVTEASILRQLSITIQDLLKTQRNFSRMWRDAIKGTRSTCYIIIVYSLKDAEVEIAFDSSNRGLDSFVLGDVPAIVLDLKAVFEEVHQCAAVE